MRMLRLLLASVILSLFVVTPVQADPGQGAIITRENGWTFGYFWNDYTITGSDEKTATWRPSFVGIVNRDRGGVE